MRRCKIWVIFIVFLMAMPTFSKSIRISKAQLKDKIMGGWAGQTVGCTFGGPTEFRSRGTFIHDYQPISWSPGNLKWWYENSPGLYDDIYMDLTFVDVFEKEGLNAPASSFANAFAHAEYALWHANQAARFNILNGMMPPESGHWLNNPHADDIDFQIEADFAGLMSPGMVNSASEICDRIGHIMNYGDGWYGGVYIAALYALSFVSDDVQWIVKQALKAIPQQSLFAQTISDVIRWHQENPRDWKENWFKVQKKWAEDVGCPNGVFDSFNIDAKVNSAWVVIGLLYGEKDFGKTISIATRCGDDSDCNPASAGGILGTILGYSQIPSFWKQGLSDVEDLDFKYTTISLNDAYEMSFKHALEMIQRNGGVVEEDEVRIETQNIKPVKLEIGFLNHYPNEKIHLKTRFINEASFEFEGIGFVLDGDLRNLSGLDQVLQVEMRIDGILLETSSLSSNFTTRKTPLFWRYQLPRKKHEVRLKILNQIQDVEIFLRDAVVYDDKPLQPQY